MEKFDTTILEAHAKNSDGDLANVQVFVRRHGRQTHYVLHCIEMQDEGCSMDGASAAGPSSTSWYKCTKPPRGQLQYMNRELLCIC